MHEQKTEKRIILTVTTYAVVDDNQPVVPHYSPGKKRLTESEVIFTAMH
jgi:hypothetical protein